MMTVPAFLSPWPFGPALTKAFCVRVAWRSTYRPLDRHYSRVQSQPNLNPRISTNAGPPGRRKAAHDRAVRRKIAGAAPILIIVGVVIIYTLLGR